MLKVWSGIVIEILSMQIDLKNELLTFGYHDNLHLFFIKKSCQTFSMNKIFSNIACTLCQ